MSYNPCQPFLEARESSQQKVPTTIVYTQLAKAPALFHYHKNAVLQWGEKLLGIHGCGRIETGSFYLLNYMQAAFITPPSDMFGHFLCMTNNLFTLVIQIACL